VPNDSPTIPPFWLRELIRDRFREAAVVIGRTALPDSLPIEQAQQLGKAYEALRNLAEFIDGAHSEARDPLQVAEEVLSVLLGGLDQALTRERSWDGIRAENDATLDEFATFDPEIQRKLIREVVGRAPRA
jgi:hypothetical protein